MLTAQLERPVRKAIEGLERATRTAMETKASLGAALRDLEHHPDYRAARATKQRDAEKEARDVEKAIRAADGNLSRAAAMLGCGRGALYGKIAAAGLQLEPGGSRGKQDVLRNPVQVSMQLEAALWARTRAEAARQGATLSRYVRKALEASLGAK